MNPGTLASKPDDGAAAVPASGTVLAFDFGLKRTGVAVGDLALGVAHPLVTLASGDGHALERDLDRLVSEWEPVMFVVGMPTTDDGRPHRLADTIRAWAGRLHDRYRVPLRFVDESLSSHAAGLALAETGVRGVRQKRHLDAVAAQQILQDFMDGQHAIA
ncbi:MAG: Holliday junction resolvase RuvX [Betaproteobacteria bacterium]|nr:Holliday junction resolvase RuvX [Betaproteobacteria bacterium]